MTRKEIERLAKNFGSEFENGVYNDWESRLYVVWDGELFDCITENMVELLNSHRTGMKKIFIEKEGRFVRDLTEKEIKTVTNW